MYNLRQHLELFSGPGSFLFRGTLPSSEFKDPYVGLGVTPTTIDPVVATLFACRYRTLGSAIVLIALKANFASLLNGPNGASFHYEYAVNIEWPPNEFEKLAQCRVTVDNSLTILDELGYRLPRRLPDLGALTHALTESPRMLITDIDAYVERCRNSIQGT